MKKGLFLLGLMSCATIVTAVTYLYRTDAKQQSYENEVARNQDWADQQWEALGI